MEVMPSDIELLESAVDERPSQEPAMLEFAEAESVLAEEPTAPHVDEWTSTPLVEEDQQSGTSRDASSTDEGASDYGEPVTEPEPFTADADSSDVALLEDPMEVTASYAIPVDPNGDVALIDPASQAPATGLDSSTPLTSLSAAQETPTLELSAIEAEPGPSASPPVDMPWETSEEMVAYEESAPPAASEAGTESPTFDAADLGAEIEPSAPAPAFPSEEHVPSLELRPVQVAPDLQADTVELTDSYEPEAAQPAYETASTVDQFDLSGDPNEPLPLASANEFLGHSEQHGAEVSSEPVPLETADTGASWSGDDGVSGESIPLESAAEYVSSPEFVSASTTWGHQPGSEELAAETEQAPESTTAFGTSLGADADTSAMEAQPEWGAPVEEQPVMEAQPEWASEEPAAPAEAQPEWSAPIEEQPVLEAQPEWNATADSQPPMEVQAEWTTAAESAAPAEAQPEWAAPAEGQTEWAAAEEQPVAEAQPEWAAPAEGQTEWAAAEEQPVTEAQPEWAAPAEGQPEWAAAEEQPVTEAQPEWAAPAEGQPEWAAAEEQPVMEAQPEWSAPAEGQTEWAAAEEQQPVAEAQPEWATAEEQPVMEAQPEWSAPAEPQPEWSSGGAAQDWNAPVEEVQTEWTSEAPAQEHWSEPQQPPAWGQSADAYSVPVEELSGAEPAMSAAELPVMEVEAEPEVMEAEPEMLEVDLASAEPELPVMEAEPEMPEIDLSEDIVEPPPVAVPVSRPAAVAMPPPPPPPPAPVASNAVLVPGAPPPRATLSMPSLSSAAAQPASAPVLAPVNAFIEGEHRVIIHTVEGQVKRGAIRDVDLLDESIPLEQQTGFAPERIPIKRVKAVFFMLPTGSRPPQLDGQKIRITFIDGRQVAGFSHDYKNTGEGFFVIPADTRTNTSRIFIYRSSVQAIAEG
jgi:hypothetical protein